MYVTTFDTYVQDVIAHVKDVKAENVGVPVYLMGHSMVDIVKPPIKALWDRTNVPTKDKLKKLMHTQYRNHNLSTKDKQLVLKVSFIEGFHCSECPIILGWCGGYSSCCAKEGVI